MACMPWHLRTREQMGIDCRIRMGNTWRPLADENFHLGLGFTAGVTARDNWNTSLSRFYCHWPPWVMAQ